jgi:hypothetical protein
MMKLVARMICLLILELLERLVYICDQVNNVTG